MAVDLGTVSKEMFEPHTGSRFTVRLEDGRTLELELVETVALRTPPKAPRESFLLRFRSAARTHVPQQIYALEHEQLGSLEIFLVPIGPDPTGMIYEAVFS